ncbi:radical SAM/SPASM domain-containing protein [Streptomyces roseifaciens]
MTTALPIERTTTYLWLDVTRKCQLECTHCYNGSGPQGDHGTMTVVDWFGVLDQAVEVGVENVTVIGGEPMMYPHTIEIADRALTLGIKVEVYSNLVHVTDAWWALLQREGMSLAASYYSNVASEHNKITSRRSHARTRANIIKALSLSVPIRVGVVGDSEKVIAAAKADLESIGVTEIRSDHIRQFGRASCGQKPDASALCGGCGDGRASIGPTGTVSPCVLSTWVGVGNVREDELASILSGPELSGVVDSFREVWGWGKDKDKDKDGGGQNQPCDPDCVPKNPCDPRCGPNASCQPGSPGTECPPRN